MNAFVPSRDQRCWSVVSCLWADLNISSRAVHKQSPAAVAAPIQYRRLQTTAPEEAHSSLPVVAHMKRQHFLLFE